MASYTVDVGIQECSKCEYKLRCSECAARPALEFLRRGKACENCKLKGCIYRPPKGETRFNCIFRTDEPDALMPTFVIPAPPSFGAEMKEEENV